MDVSLPGPAFLAVEHPGKVRNLDRALATLGGPIALRSMADDPTSSTLELRFRPEDRFEHPVVSTTARTNNILIKVVREETPDVSMTPETISVAELSRAGRCKYGRSLLVPSSTR